MKNILKIALILFLGLFAPVFAMDDMEYMSIEEYQKFFEMGLTEQPVNGGKEEEFKPKLKEKVDLDSPDVINISDEAIKLKIEKSAFLSPYKEIFKEDKARTSLYKTQRLDVFSEGTKELSDYMTHNLKTTMNAQYVLNNKISVQAGHETWYVNPNASLGSRKFYFNPRLNVTDKCYLDYVSRYNQTTKNVEQEVGVNYKPKLFKDNAAFGIKATTIINEERQIKSQRLKFSTDFYIF